MTVGKVVQFIILYSIPTGAKRDYGTIYLQTGQSLPDAAVAEGWVKLREETSRKDESESSKALFEKLALAEASAKASSKGIWASAGGNIENTYEVPDPKGFVEQYKDKPVEGIVERVLTGDRMIVRLCLSTKKHVQTMVLVAGIRAPATKRTNPSDGKEQAAEPFGPEAHEFVESRLLQRTVEVNVLGLSPQGILVCTVISIQRCLAVKCPSFERLRRKLRTRERGFFKDSPTTFREPAKQTLRLPAFKQRILST